MPESKPHIIRLAHKVELNPTEEQRLYFARACGVARFAYNWALRQWMDKRAAGSKPNDPALRRQLNAIKESEFPWMSEVTKCAPQQAIRNLGTAFSRFFRQQSKHPRFQKKGLHDSFRADNGPPDKSSSAVEVAGCSVFLPRIGEVRMKEALRFKGRVISCTISRVAHKWFASFQVEVDHVLPARENQAVVGVDLGVTVLATLSDGTVFENPKALRSQLRKLKRLQQAVARKRKGSANRRKACLKVAQLHYHIRCLRQDTLHKLTTFLVRNYAVIGIEHLNVSGMLKNRRLSRAIADVGFYEFRRQLEYKAKLYGVRVVVADRWFPSSKTCSECGCVKDSLSLSERMWTCAECGARHDRELNAACNLEIMAGSHPVTACGEVVRLGRNIERTSKKQERKLVA